MIWFYVGDVIEWLESGRNISGVQRVCLELLFAAADLAKGDAGISIGVCAFDPQRRNLLVLPTDETLAYFRHDGAAPNTFAQRVRHMLSRPAQTPGRRAPPPASATIAFGTLDHVLFLGLVWAPPFIPLFRTLRQAGTKFSVLVYDMIQIQRPDLVGDAMGREFAAWLATVLQTADTIFVSSTITQRAVIAWAESQRLRVPLAIKTLRFGMSHLALTNAGRPKSAVRRGDYVLSVGTIDRRKNQAMLFGIWHELIGTLGPSRVPQLVVVGRRDLPALDQNAQRLIAQRQILIVQGANDTEVAALYAHCRFTTFPSLAEGYGLPVAESLRFGKVCITSDLPEVREFAGDLVWYFPVGDRDAATAQIRRAIAAPDLLLAQESRIAAGFVPPLWRDAASSILHDLAP